MADGSNEKRWAGRVEEWRASGLTSTEYCEGRDFTAGGLRHWAYKLRRKGGGKTTALVQRPAVRVLRVERVPAELATPASVGSPLRIELGAARVAVPAGFDAATLRTVLEVLVATAGGRP